MLIVIAILAALIYLVASDGGRLDRNG